MTGLDLVGRGWLLARAMVTLRRRTDPAALLRANGPRALARAALLPAGRNLAVAIALLPYGLRHEATAAFLCCRALDAFEDLGGTHRERAAHVQAAVDFLCHAATPAPVIADRPVRDSELVDLILAQRLGDLRDLVDLLAEPSRARVRAMLCDIGTAMVANLHQPMARSAYGALVLGRAAAYAGELISDGPFASGEFFAAAGNLTQLANDLRDRELELYDSVTQTELMLKVFLRLPPLIVATLNLLATVGEATTYRGARAAASYMAITTSAFLCRQADSPAPYRRSRRIAAAVYAGVSLSAYRVTLSRVAEAANAALEKVVARSGSGRPGGQDRLAPFCAEPATSITDQLLGTAFRLLDELPAAELTEGLPRTDVFRLMLADHLALDALDRIDPARAGDMQALADLVQRTAAERVGHKTSFAPHDTAKPVEAVAAKRPLAAADRREALA